MKRSFLHTHDGMGVNPNEKHSLVDEANRIEALDLISKLQAENERLNTVWQEICRIVEQGKE